MGNLSNVIVKNIERSEFIRFVRMVLNFDPTNYISLEATYIDLIDYVLSYVEKNSLHFMFLNELKNSFPIPPILSLETPKIDLPQAVNMSNINPTTSNALLEYRLTQVQAEVVRLNQLLGIAGEAGLRDTIKSLESTCTALEHKIDQLEKDIEKLRVALNQRREIAAPNYFLYFFIFFSVLLLITLGLIIYGFIQ